MNKKIRCVYFDVYDTLASTSPLVAEDVSRYGKNINEFNEFIGPIAKQADHGKISFTDYQKRYSEFFGKDLSYLPLHLLPRLKPIAETHALVRLLDCAETPIGIISDVSPNALRQTISSGAVPYVNFFSIIESNKHGKRKTHGLLDEASKIAHERLGIGPDELLLIDDSQSNVDAAKELGWNAAIFNHNHPRTSIAEILANYDLF